MCPFSTFYPEISAFTPQTTQELSLMYQAPNLAPTLADEPACSVFLHRIGQVHTDG